MTPLPLWRNAGKNGLEEDPEFKPYPDALSSLPIPDNPALDVPLLFVCMFEVPL
jgi:hypothetical protein